MRTRTKVMAGVITLLLLAATFVVVGQWGDDTPRDERSRAQSSHLTPPAGPSVPGYTAKDLFGDGRFFFQYLNKDWEEARTTQYPGVRQITITTHCDVMDRAAVCPRLTLIDERSDYYQQQFGSSPVVQTLQYQPCGLDGSKSGAFEPLDMITILDIPVQHYRQTLCDYGKYPVQIHRHMWFNEMQGLLVILTGADNRRAMTDVTDRDVAAVEKSLSNLQLQH